MEASGRGRAEWHDPGDWERARQALADGSIAEALREHISEGGEGRCLEWCPICRTAEALSANASPELRRQLSLIQREALLTMRTLIDRYLERSGEDREPRPGRVEDIPIS